MALLYTITLNLSSDLSTQLVRVEDQALRIVSLLSSFFSMYSFLIASRNRKSCLLRLDHKNPRHVPLRGPGLQILPALRDIDGAYSLLQLVYTIAYIIYNVSHTYAVNYNILKEDYEELKATTSVYTAVGIIGWIFTIVNTYKYQIQQK